MSTSTMWVQLRVYFLLCRNPLKEINNYYKVKKKLQCEDCNKANYRFLSIMVEGDEPFSASALTEERSEDTGSQDQKFVNILDSVGS